LKRAERLDSKCISRAFAALEERRGREARREKRQNFIVIGRHEARMRRPAGVLISARARHRIPPVGRDRTCARTCRRPRRPLRVVQCCTQYCEPLFFSSPCSFASCCYLHLPLHILLETASNGAQTNARGVLKVRKANRREVGAIPRQRVRMRRGCANIGNVAASVAPLRLTASPCHSRKRFFSSRSRANSRLFGSSKSPARRLSAVMIDELMCHTSEH